MVLASEQPSLISAAVEERKKSKTLQQQPQQLGLDFSTALFLSHCRIIVIIISSSSAVLEAKRQKGKERKRKKEKRSAQ